MKLLDLLLVTLVGLAGCHVSYMTESDAHLYANSKVYRAFIIPKEMIAKYPKTYTQFIKALEMWKAVLPIEYQIFTGHEGPEGSICVLFCDLHKAYPNMPKDVVGEFIPETNMLMVNNNGVDSDDDMLFDICLHELGHSFGLPHIVGRDDGENKNVFKYGAAKDIILDTDKEASDCIMYPYVSKDRKGISKIEALWALHFLMHDITVGNDSKACILLTNSERVKHGPKKIPLH